MLLTASVLKYIFIKLSGFSKLFAGSKCPVSCCTSEKFSSELIKFEVYRFLWLNSIEYIRLLWDLSIPPLNFFDCGISSSFSCPTFLQVFLPVWDFLTYHLLHCLPYLSAVIFLFIYNSFYLSLVCILPNFFHCSHANRLSHRAGTRERPKLFN